VSKIRDSARGRECQIRIPKCCNFDDTTTVLAHLNGYGMGGKNHDFQGAYACSACHDAVDGRVIPIGMSFGELKVYFMDGIIRTQQILFNEGLIQTKGSK